MMERIFNFSDFSALYEAEDPKIYEQNLKIVVSDLLALYYEMTEYGAYTDAEIDSDLQAIVAGNSLANKIEAFKSIISKVKQKALTTDKIEGSKELFDIIDSAYNKYLEALTYIANKYKDSKEESDSMTAFVNKEVEAYKAFLDEETSESNSNFSGYSQIFEGKKSLLSDAETTVNSLRGKIDSYKMDEDPRKKKFATDADLEIVKISNLIKGLKEKKNRDIEKNEIEGIFNSLKALETKFDTGINKIIDENTTDAELEKLRNKARDVKDQISPLRNKYLKTKSAAEVKGKSEKIKVSLDKDRIEYDVDEIKNVNPEVKKFQELVTDAFKNVKSITDLPFYQKMGIDGKFGPNTRDMVKTLKGAFELSDKSGDITKELSDEIQIQKDTIKESVSVRVYKFSSFVNISEAAFNLAKGLEVAKSLPTYKSSPSGGSKMSGGSGSSKSSSYKEGATGGSVTAIHLAMKFPETSEEFKTKTFGPETKKFLIEWQKKNGIEPASGIVGEKTLKKMIEVKSLGPWTKDQLPKMLAKVTGIEPSKEEDEKSPYGWKPSKEKEVKKEEVKKEDPLKNENAKAALLGAIKNLSGLTEDEGGFALSIKNNIKTQKDLDDANSLLKKLRIGPKALRKKSWVGSSIEKILNDKNRIDNKFYQNLYDLAKDYMDITDNYSKVGKDFQLGDFLKLLRDGFGS
jgi:peptidoglycan hydrolase-like protein with peptidoglycan-binding domain